MHNLEVIVELAKQGMTYDQIKDLITMQSQDEPKDEPENNDPEPNEPEPTDPGAGPEPEEPENNDPEPDYKSLYEQSQRDLRAAQDLNKKQNNETQEKSEEEKLTDLFTELYF